MEFQINQDVKFNYHPNFEQKATAIKINKYYQKAVPIGISKQIDSYSNPEFKKWQTSGMVLDRKTDYFLDFGTHCVGRINLKLEAVGSPPDAPAKIQLLLGERLFEVTRETSDYSGILSASWIQESLLTVDILPAEIQLPRRFAFRYIRVRIIDTSPKYQLKLNIECQTESSADIKFIEPLATADSLLKEIDLVSQKTLRQCMQDVFEDGPKRDRRLWLGDLRLQALANYATFKNNDLVKKCLYLFAAHISEEGLVSANVYIEPNLIPDDTFLADYSLFFIDTLLTYYQETKDETTMEDLYPIAVQQMASLSKAISENGQINMQEGWWAFIDWNEPLDKQVAVHGIFIYASKKLAELAEIRHNQQLFESLNEQIVLLERFALSQYYVEASGVFVNPETQQISIASQVWLILAKIGTKQFRKKILVRLLKLPQKEIVGCKSPYMYHHFIEALFQEGFSEKAIQLIKAYWGGMIAQGADTFWEVYDPDDAELSPYGDIRINSFCHAWSCTPCYLLRRYGVESDE